MVLHPWSWPTAPWKRIHVDYAGPFLGNMYLVVVDAHSKWAEVIITTSTTSENTILELRKLFAAHRVARQLISDNGPQFTSLEFEAFMKSNGIRHICSAPYHPQSNGEAECMKKLGRGDVQTKLCRFLLSYRTTPHCTTGITPSELFLKRRIRTRLDLLRPEVDSEVNKKQAAYKHHHDKNSHCREFELGERVLVENLRGPPKWLQAVVVEKLGAVTYRVQVGDAVWVRHADQMLQQLASGCHQDRGEPDR